MLWYIRQIYNIPKYQIENWKNNIQFPLEQEKIQLRHWAQLSILRSRQGILDRHTVTLYKNEMESKFINSHQWSLERSHAVLTEINADFWWRPSPFSTKTDSFRSTSHKTLQKKSNEDFFIQLLYAWLYLTNNDFPPHIYTRYSCPTNIFKATHQPNLIYDILQETRFSYCQP